MTEAGPMLIAGLSLLCLVVAIAGCVYTLLAVVCAAGLRRQKPAVTGGSHPKVSVLKPLCGAEPRLAEALASFIRQDYPAPYEVLFGIQDPADPAVGVVQELIGPHPSEGLKLLINPTLHGPNRKVSNLVNLSDVASGDIIMLADSDMQVDADHLSRVVEALHKPGVGLVTCLYRGVPAAGFWSRLSAMQIDHHFLPGVLVGLRLRLAKPCFGSTMALRRDTLDRIGGFRAFSRCLPDDYAMGAAVRGLGYDVAVLPSVLDHACSETNFAALFMHELRWARTIRLINPLGFGASVLTHPVPIAILALALSPGFTAAGVLLGSLACRTALQIQINQRLGSAAGTLWLGPVRDVLSFAVFLTSFWPSSVRWRDRPYRIGRDGMLT